MFDIRFIRTHPNVLDDSQKRRGLSPVSDDILALDLKLRENLTRLQEFQNQKNLIAKSIGENKRNGIDSAALILEGERLKHLIATCEEQVRTEESTLHTALSTIPNSLDSDCPNGKDETDNKVLKQSGTRPQFSFRPMHHYEIGEHMGGMDFERAVHMSGSRFVVLKGALARLERALAQFMLDINTNKFGYTEISPPFMVKEPALFGVGQFPKFKDDLFATTTGHWLISTAEVALTNLVAGKILDNDVLPLRYTAYTPCFRSEAGAAGKDTRGMIRLHQFSKVELVSITRPSDSKSEHERMTEVAEFLLDSLELPYQRIVLCSGDMGFQSQKTYDLEVWLPGSNQYREVSSCSNCGDFQARRMHAKYRKGGEKSEFVHTLNGSALPIGRTLAAVLENYQTEKGGVIIPSVLIPYMGGKCQITPHGLLE